MLNVRTAKSTAWVKEDDQTATPIDKFKLKALTLKIKENNPDIMQIYAYNRDYSNYNTLVTKFPIGNGRHLYAAVNTIETGLEEIIYEFNRTISWTKKKYEYYKGGATVADKNYILFIRRQISALSNYEYKGSSLMPGHEVSEFAEQLAKKYNNIVFLNEALHKELKNKLNIVSIDDLL